MFLLALMCAVLLCCVAMADYTVEDGVAEVDNFADFQKAAEDENVSTIKICGDLVIEDDITVKDKQIIVGKGCSFSVAPDATLTHTNEDPEAGWFRFEDLDPSDPQNFYRFASSDTCFLLYREGEGAWYRKICGNDALEENFKDDVEGHTFLCAALNGHVYLRMSSIPVSNLFVLPDSEGLCSLAVPYRSTLDGVNAQVDGLIYYAAETAQVHTFEEFKEAADNPNISTITVYGNIEITEDVEVLNKYIIINEGYTFTVADDATLTHTNTNPMSGGFRFDDLPPTSVDNFYRLAGNDVCFLVFRNDDDAWYRKICGSSVAVANAEAVPDGYFCQAVVLNGNAVLDHDISASTFMVLPNSAGECSLTINYGVTLDADYVEVKGPTNDLNDIVIPDIPDTPVTPGDGNVETEPSTPSTSGGSTTVSAEVKPTVSGSTASAQVSSGSMDSIVESVLTESAAQNTAPSVELNVETTAGVDSVKVTLPSSSLASLGENSSATLTINSGVGSVTIDSAAISTVAAAEGSEVTVSLSAVPASDLNSRQQAAVGDAPVYDISISSGNVTISDLGGGLATVALPYTLSAGQDPSSVVVWFMDANGNISRCETMYDLRSGSVIFTTPHFSLYVVGSSALPFTDVAKTDWFYTAVAFAYDNALMNGVGDSSFNPNGTLTRAMVWTILARMDGVDTTGGETWYSKAQAWAMESGVSDGTDPNGAITREQLVTMLYRVQGEPAAAASLVGFADAGAISDYAADAVKWAVDTGLFKGDDNAKLNPTASSTRAEAATVFMRYAAL